MSRSPETGSIPIEYKLKPTNLAQELQLSSQRIQVDDGATEPGINPQVNEKEYPFGCFSAQVHFASRWAAVTGSSFTEALLKKTAIYRTLTGEILRPEDAPPEGVSNILDKVYTSHGIDGLTRTLFDAYTQLPGNNYHPHYRFGAFDYKYNESDHVIKVHFENPQRGESPLAPEKICQRRDDLRSMFTHIHAAHPDVRTVVSASWIRSIKGYQALFPPDIDSPRDLMSPAMFFAGDSVWGQFIDRNGNVNTRVYTQFLESLSTAQNTTDLVNAFPFKVRLVEDPIEKYYKYYNVETSK